MLRLLTTLLLLTAASAIAEPRIAVMPFSGPKSSVVKKQVVKKLCAKFTCVTPKKGSRLTVDAVVVGTVSGKEVELKVYVEQDTQPLTRFLKVGPTGKLSASALDGAPRAVKDALKDFETDTSPKGNGHVARR